MSDKLITPDDIRDWRATLGKTQAEFANMVEVAGVASFSSLAKYEIGIHVNSPRAQAKLRLIRKNIAPLLIGRMGQ